MSGKLAIKYKDGHPDALIGPSDSTATGSYTPLVSMSVYFADASTDGRLVLLLQVIYCHRDYIS